MGMLRFLGQMPSGYGSSRSSWPGQGCRRLAAWPHTRPADHSMKMTLHSRCWHLQLQMWGMRHAACMMMGWLPEPFGMTSADPFQSLTQGLSSSRPSLSMATKHPPSACPCMTSPICLSTPKCSNPRRPGSPPLISPLHLQMECSGITHLLQQMQGCFQANILDKPPMQLLLRVRSSCCSSW